MTQRLALKGHDYFSHILVPIIDAKATRAATCIMNQGPQAAYRHTQMAGVRNDLCSDLGGSRMESRLMAFCDHFKNAVAESVPEIPILGKT